MQKTEEIIVSNNLKGMTGVYMVATEICRRNHYASVTSRNAKGVDILINSEDAKSVVAIQVKTGLDGKNSWRMNRKDENYHSEFLYYVFVAIDHLGAEPRFYIVPSKIVADRIYESHRLFLNTPGKNGKEHKDSDIRLFVIKDEEYKDKWRQLNIGDRVV